MSSDLHAVVASLPPWKPQGESCIRGLLDALPPEKSDTGDPMAVCVLTPWLSPPLRVRCLPSWGLARWLFTLAETLRLSPYALLSFDRDGPKPQCYADHAKLIPHPAAYDDPQHIIESVKRMEKSRTPGDPRTVYRMENRTVVKKIYDSEAAQSEALSMAMVRSATSIPVPELRQVIVDGSTTYLVMDKIEGHNLKECWAHLPFGARLRVVWILRGYISQLRRLRRSVPGTLYGGRCDGPLFTEAGAGPFQSYDDMMAWFNHKLEVSQRMRQAPINAPRFNSESPLVFTHQDLCPRNVILANDGTLYVIDWEYAGFYPEWVEYTTMSYQMDLPTSWRWMVPLIAGLYKRMAACVRNIGWALTIGMMM